MMMQPHETKNKEQFKLLQYSDDSKSLSDLELTEIVVPRKRKVRRKTKPKNGHRHRKQLSGDGSGTGACGNIGVWVAIGSNVGWLLILSYIVSMVHSEYAQINREQAKLTAALKTLPDEWHDKAHGLEVNQSTLFHQLFDLQQTVKNLTEEFRQLRTVVQQQQTQATDVARVGMLEKSLADFGASLKSVNSEIDSLKSHSLKWGDAITRNAEAIDDFQKMVVQRRLNETTEGQSQSEGSGKENSEKVNEEIVALKNVSQSFNQRLELVNSTVFECRQKMDELEKTHAKKINDLHESVANITSQDVNQAMKNYQDKMAGLEGRVVGVEKVTEKLEQDQKGWEQLKSQLEGFNASMQRLQTPVNRSAATTGGEEKEKESGGGEQQQEKQEQQRRGREGAPMM